LNLMVVPLTLPGASVLVVVDCEVELGATSVVFISSSLSFSALVVDGIWVVGFGNRINCFLLMKIFVLPITDDSVMDVTMLVTVLVKSSLKVVGASVEGSVVTISKVVGRVFGSVVGASVLDMAFTT